MPASSHSLTRTLKTNNGYSIPQIHLGVYLMSGREARDAVKWALEIGYRGIDSAQMYHKNRPDTWAPEYPSVVVLYELTSVISEKDCGEAIRSFLNNPEINTEGIQRKDIFFTSKLASNSSYGAARKSIRKSVDACGLGYIDLFLLHSPYGGPSSRLESWRAVEDAIAAGEVKIGGVSNFGVKHLEELMGAKPRILPAVNQIEVHPFNTRTPITSYCRKHGILVEAYAPLARALRMQHPTVLDLSSRYGCTPAQLLVRWSVQHGYIPLPKSIRKDRIQSNAEIDHFKIDEDGMMALDNCDEYLVTDWDPVDAD